MNGQKRNIIGTCFGILLALMAGAPVFADDPDCTGADCAPPPIACIGVECFDPGFANNPVRTLWTQDGIE
jgi:hypothetical protein